MFRYNWWAIQDDGTEVHRWNEDGTENSPDPWLTRQMHFIPEKTDPVFSIFVPKGANLMYVKRRHTDFGESLDIVNEGIDVIYIFGWSFPDYPDVACYTFLLPDGRIEQSNDLFHITRYERNLDVHPLEKWELLGAPKEIVQKSGTLVFDGMPAQGEIWTDFFIDAEIVEPSEDDIVNNLLSFLDEDTMFGPDSVYVSV